MFLSLLLMAAVAPPLGYDPPSPEAKAQAAETAQPPQRIATLVVYGSDPCPRSSGDEIVVCARQPESERYRIPKALRGKPKTAAADGSWAGTAKMLEMVSQQGLPNSCNPTGSNGQSGCFAKFLRENGR